MPIIEPNGRGFSVKLEAPAFKKPLPQPTRTVIPLPEQFAGPVEVVRKEVAATVEQPLVRAKEPAYRSFQVVPHANVKNEKIDHFADILAESYREIFDRIGFGLRIEDQDRVFFETVIEAKSFRTYITTNTPLVESLKQQANTTWKNVTLIDVESPVDAAQKENSIGYDMKFKRHFFQSLKTDRRMQETPLGEIAELTRGMSAEDRVIIQFGFQNAEDGWQKEAVKEMESYDDVVKKKKAKAPGSSTAMKPSHDGYDFALRILVTSPDERRRRMLARGVILALKQLNGDNELVERPVSRWRMKRWLRRMQRRHIAAPMFRMNRRQIVTALEIAHFVKLPQRSLQQEYPHLVEAVRLPETQLPDELFKVNIRGIDIGTVIEKGVKHTARIPLEPFELETKGGKEVIEQKYVDDAYCGTEFSFGETGVGKTGEAIHRAVSAICNGQTVFLIDSADGEVCRDLHDRLPADYPEEKIIHLDLTNKAWPIALRWALRLARSASGTDDEELDREKAKEAARVLLREYIAGITKEEFSDRMDRFLNVAARAAGASPLDIELALTSPAFREELLEREEVAAEQDLVFALEELQDKARRGSDSSTVDGILSRLGKLAEDKFRTNLFFQEPEEALDFRKYADNEDGGYGYCVTIYCDKMSFGEDGQEAILTFMFAKILLEGGYSRVDINQAQRKKFVVILDEAHRYIRGRMATKLGEDAAVELRKYRTKLVLMGHSRAQLGKVWDAFEAGGVQVTMYKSKDVQAFRDMAAVMAPLDPETAWAALGKHEAVVTRKLPSKREVSFICKMAPPPPFVKDRSARREACARQFGRHWKEVSAEIQAKRLMYAEKDRLWYQRMTEEAERMKEERKVMKKQKVSA